MGCDTAHNQPSAMAPTHHLLADRRLQSWTRLAQEVPLIYSTPDDCTQRIKRPAAEVVAVHCPAQPLIQSIIQPWLQCP